MVVGGKTPTTAKNTPTTKTISIQFITYQTIVHIINWQPNSCGLFGCQLIISNFRFQP
jgi:hypothetical protein